MVVKHEALEAYSRIVSSRHGCGECAAISLVSCSNYGLREDDGVEETAERSYSGGVCKDSLGVVLHGWSSPGTQFPRVN